VKCIGCNCDETLKRKDLKGIKSSVFTCPKCKDGEHLVEIILLWGHPVLLEEDKKTKWVYKD